MKGRPKGYRKYSREFVQDICDVYDGDNLSVRDISKQHNLSYTLAWTMITGRYYPDIRAKNFKPFRATPLERKLTSEQAEMIIFQHKDGKRIQHLAKEYGVSNSAIEQILRGESYKEANGKRGIIKIRILTDDKVITVRRMIKEGYATREIMETLDISQSNVYIAATKDKWQHLNEQYPPVTHLEYRRVVFALTPQQRKEIRAYFKSGNATMTMTEVAKLYGVSLSYISRVVKGER